MDYILDHDLELVSQVLAEHLQLLDLFVGLIFPLVAPIFEVFYPGLQVLDLGLVVLSVLD